MLGGSTNTWGKQEHVTIPILRDGPLLHIIKDLSAWVPPQRSDWPNDKLELLQRFSASLFKQNRLEYFLIAANDGQLVETWRRLPDSPDILKTRELFETLLVEEHTQTEGVPLRFFNLSRTPSSDLLDRALRAFLDHEGWRTCHDTTDAPEDFWGPSVQSGVTMKYCLRHWFKSGSRNCLNFATIARFTFRFGRYCCS